MGIAISLHAFTTLLQGLRWPFRQPARQVPSSLVGTVKGVPLKSQGHHQMGSNFCHPTASSSRRRCHGHQYDEGAQLFFPSSSWADVRRFGTTVTSHTAGSLRPVGWGSTAWQ